MKKQIKVPEKNTTKQQTATVQPQQGPGVPERWVRRRRMEIRQLHSSEAGEALTRLLQVQVDFYIFLFGID